MGGSTYGGTPPAGKMNAIEAFQQGRGRPPATSWMPHLVIATMLLCLGVYHVHLLVCYWPLYIPVECSYHSATLKEFAANEESISLLVELTSLCQNDNSYEATVIASGRGLAYVGATGPAALQAGLVAAKAVVLPAKTPGETIWTTVEGVARLSLGGNEAAELNSHFWEDPQVPLSWEWQLALSVKLPFGMLTTWSENVVAWQACRANFVSALAQRKAERENQSPAMWQATHMDGHADRNRVDFIGCRDTWASWKEAPESSADTKHRMVATMPAEKLYHGEVLKGLALMAPALFCFFFSALVYSRLFVVAKGVWLAASAARLLVRADLDSPTSRGEFEAGLMGDDSVEDY